MPPYLFGQGAFDEFLEERPDIAYYSFQDQLSRTPSQRRFFENQFRNIQNRYLGQLGSQLRAGRMPTRRFTDFLSDFPFQQEYYSRSPSMRGSYPSQFAPRTRFIPF